MNTAAITLLISMVPVVELRGAIPYGVVAGLSVKEALFFSVIGNLIPVPFIIIFIRKIFSWMRTKSFKLNKIVERFEKKANSHRETVKKYEFIGLVLIVAIPLPGTGAWTGSLVAAMMDMRLKRAFPAILTGVIIAGIIVAWITYGASALA